MEALGLGVTPHPVPGARCYAVIVARSNARWWLVPLNTGRLTASGLALYQPISVGGRLLKAAAVTLSRLNLHKLWARSRVFISGEPRLEEHFQATEALWYAYFTGTDSPHRKLAIQVMDSRGRLKGFAKFTRDKQVGALLAHEAYMLNKIKTMNLSTCHVPRVMFCGSENRGTLLVTDTLKSTATTTAIEFTHAHRDFLAELRARTEEPDPLTTDELAMRLANRMDHVDPYLSDAWRRRLRGAIGLIASGEIRLPTCLSQGDFTPWNSFLVEKKLYVFDWEYAEQRQAASNDVIHFVLNQPSCRRLPPLSKIQAVREYLSECWRGLPEQVQPILLLAYLVSATFRQIERLVANDMRADSWDGQRDIEQMLDALLDPAKRCFHVPAACVTRSS